MTNVVGVTSHKTLFLQKCNNILFAKPNSIFQIFHTMTYLLPNNDSAHSHFMPYFSIRCLFICTLWHNFAQKGQTPKANHWFIVVSLCFPCAKIEVENPAFCLKYLQKEHKIVSLNEVVLFFMRIYVLGNKPCNSNFEVVQTVLKYYLLHFFILKVQILSLLSIGRISFFFLIFCWCNYVLFCLCTNRT